MKDSPKADIWMPLYIGDYLADTTRLTTEQHGAYLLLIMDYWRSGRLPDNDAVLSQITRLSPDAWSNARTMLKHFFCIEDGQWVHKRIDEELTKASVNKEAARDKASKAAQARWNKQQNDAPSNATSMPQAMLEDMLEECPSPSPSPSSLPATTSTTEPSKKHSAKSLLAEIGVVGQLADDFIKLRKSKRAPISKTAIDAIFREAQKANISPQHAIAICVERSWQGFNADWLIQRNASLSKGDQTRQAMRNFLGDDF